MPYKVNDPDAPERPVIDDEQLKRMMNAKTPGFFERNRFRLVTIVLIALNVIVFAAEAAISLLAGARMGVSLDIPTRVLVDMGAAATTTDVLCARLNDEPGELARVMGVMADCGINVTYSYSLISTYIALSVKDLARAEQLLAGEPVELIGQDDLARSLGPDGLAAACGEGR